MICRTASAVLLATFADGWRPASIGSIDHPELPARCHWAEEPDAERCVLLLDALTLAWSVQVDTLGFRAPMPDEDGLLDLYFTTEGTGGGAYALGPYEDEDRTDGRMGSHAFLAFDSGIPDSSLPSYVAHELQHVLQYASDFVEPSYPVWEGVATAAERWTLPGGRQSRWGFADFQNEPQLGLLASGADAEDPYSLYEYGAALWIHHLDAHLDTPDGEAARRLWRALEQDGWINEPDVLDALDAVTGDLPHYLGELAAARARIGTRDRPDWAAAWEGPSYAATRLTTLSDSDLPADVDAGGVWPTGMVFVSLDATVAGRTYTLSMADDAIADWVLVAAGPQAEVVEVGGAVLWTATSDEPLTFAAIYLGPPAWDADDAVKTGASTLRVESTRRETRPRKSDGGCACSSRHRAPSGLLLGLSAMVFSLRRRGPNRSGGATHPAVS